MTGFGSLRQVRLAFWAVLAAVQVAPASAQSPSISSISPHAVEPGRVTDVTIRGRNLAGDTRLWTSFSAAASLAADASDKPAKGDQALFRLTVPEDVVPGVYGLRVATKDGISPVELIAVDDLPTVKRASDNTARERAQPLDFPCAVDTLIEPLTLHYYRISVKAGQRLSMGILSRRLGSEMDPVLRVLDARGREIAFSDDAPGLSSDPRLVRTFNESRDYILEVRDVRYKGGGDYYYRLRLGDFPDVSVPFPMGARKGSSVTLSFAGRDVDGVSPVEISLLPASALEWLNLAAKRQDGKGSAFATLALSTDEEILETEPNDDSGHANRVPLGADLNGRFQVPGDVDRFVFHATKDRQFTFSGVTRRLGAPTDLYLKLLKPDGSAAATAEDAGPVDGVITYKFPEDGDYILVAEDLNRRGGSEYAYRIVVAPVEPGFSLFADSDTLNVPSNGTAMVTVTAKRQGFDGPIDVKATGLPVGLTQTPTVIGPGQSTAVLTLQGAKDAPTGNFEMSTITGVAQVGKNERTATASISDVLKKRLHDMPWPPPSLSEPIAVAIAPPAPFNVRVQPEEVVFGPGLAATVKVTVDRTAGDDEIALAVAPQKGGLPNGVSAAVKPIPKGQMEVDVVLSANDKSPLGTYTVVLAGSLKKDKSTITQPAPGFRIHLRPPFTIATDGQGHALAHAGETRIKVRVERNPAFKGPITLTAKNVPNGVTAQPVTVPPDSREVEFVLKAAEDAKKGETNKVLIRGEAKINKTTLSAESSPLRLMIE